ncbi:OsmC family protein [Reyranella sp.]|uniref:OsmC family protein n=1 Tax=Reyranella sp. TaxID=1929291 RepID=UPI002F92123A
MATMTVRLSSIPDTAAVLGRAGPHTIVVDRPEGTAGGMGLGFNGGELLGFAIGGCFCNDLQYVAHDMGVALESMRVDVTVSFDGDPLIATGATMRVAVTALDGAADVARLVERAREISAVANSLRRGVPVELVHGQESAHAHADRELPARSCS